MPVLTDELVLSEHELLGSVSEVSRRVCSELGDDAVPRYFVETLQSRLREAWQAHCAARREAKARVEKRLSSAAWRAAYAMYLLAYSGRLFDISARAEASDVFTFVGLALGVRHASEMTRPSSFAAFQEEAAALCGDAVLVEATSY